MPGSYRGGAFIRMISVCLSAYYLRQASNAQSLVTKGVSDGNNLIHFAGCIGLAWRSR